MTARLVRVRRSHTGHRVGECHQRARLSGDDVRLIRQLHVEGLGYGTIAQKFDVSKSTVSDVCHGRHRTYD